MFPCSDVDTSLLMQRAHPVEVFAEEHNNDVLRSKKDWVETDHPTEWDFFWADKGWVCLGALLLGQARVS